jgi:hypothetical protein
MKLFEIKKSDFSPVGIWTYDTYEQKSFSPDAVVIREDLRNNDTLRRYVLYGRKANVLAKVIEHIFVNDPIFKIESMTPDKCVISVFKDWHEYYWVNHTGTLTSWKAVKQYYRIK